MSAYTEESIRREIAEVITSQLATGQRVTPSWITAELVGRHPAEGPDRDFFIFCLHDLVLETLGRSRDELIDDAPVTVEECERQAAALKEHADELRRYLEERRQGESDRGKP